MKKFIRIGLLINMFAFAACEKESIPEQPTTNDEATSKAENARPTNFDTGARNRWFRPVGDNCVGAYTESARIRADVSIHRIGTAELFHFRLNSDGTYSIQARNGKYLDIDRSSGGYLFPNGHRHNIDCKFYIEPAGLGRYYFKSYHTKKYLTRISSTGELICNVNTPGYNDSFSIGTLNMPCQPIQGLETGRRNIGFRSWEGKFISSNNGTGRAKADRNHLYDWEKMELVYNAGDCTYSIKGNNGRYLDIEQSSGGNVVFNGDRYNIDCKFIIKHEGNNRYSFMSYATGKYMAAEPGGTLMVNRNAANAWEKFEMWVTP